MGVLTSTRFQSLSLRDLLEAREQYHVYLANKKNVVGTAVGLYLQRDDDDVSERTLQNSHVRRDSWPCVLVFVERWFDPTDFGDSPTDAVPTTLYMPDGRTVPVCVVKVDPAEALDTEPTVAQIPDTYLGGGHPLISHAQELDRRGSVGCLVTDGHTIFALTNRHVFGDAGDPVFARFHGSEVEVGVASKLQLTRQPFKVAYPNLPGARDYLNVDVGLVEVTSAHDWTSSIYGFGPTGDVFDVSDENVTVQLVDQSVVAFGGSSGSLEGVIKALFYRYKSSGGYDYIADLLIAPTGDRQTMPGDSGTVWQLETHQDRRRKHRDLHPLAVEWGGQTLQSAQRRFNFALATNLSTICRLLNVEVITNHNTQARPFWGTTGHYSIARLAIDQLPASGLADLMHANADCLSYELSDLEDGKIASTVGKNGTFIPLADVPDLVWKKLTSKPGGRDPQFNKGPEHPNHYCDIDATDSNGDTLRALCIADPSKVDAAFWMQFYDAGGHTDGADRGCLPFRVWQFYDAMVQYAQAADVAKFVAAAGTMSHYVGDACQPLHGSIYSDGYDAQKTPHTTSTGKTAFTWPGKGVHSAYENKMIDANAQDLFTRIATALTTYSVTLDPIVNGHDAAVAIVQLMDRTATTIKPTDLCDRYIALNGGTSKATIQGLWNTFGDDTATVMADGIAVLAHIWNSAWTNGNGAAIPAAELVAVATDDLVTIYDDTSFVTSHWLNDLGPLLL